MDTEAQAKSQFLREARRDEAMALFTAAKG